MISIHNALSEQGVNSLPYSNLAFAYDPIAVPVACRGHLVLRKSMSTTLGARYARFTGRLSYVTRAIAILQVRSGQGTGHRLHFIRKGQLLAFAWARMSSASRPVRPLQPNSQSAPKFL